MKHVIAPLAGFETAPAIESMLAEMSPAYCNPPTRRFPVRYLRYWFVRHLLEEMHQALGRPLRILEVGVGYGKMLAFMDGPVDGPDRRRLPALVACWDGIDAQADPRTLERYAYSSFQYANLDEPFEVEAGDNYDAVILLHVLEHVMDPERTMQRLLSAFRPGGIVVGGSPTMPDLLGRIHQRQLRRKFADKLHDVYMHKHISVISPRRVRRFARSANLAVDLLAGAFLVRSSASAMEDRGWWVRMNLAWGALFPALGGEIYFSLRK